jgi:hypothetical protein
MWYVPSPQSQELGWWVGGKICECESLLVLEFVFCLSSLSFLLSRRKLPPPLLERQSWLYSVTDKKWLIGTQNIREQGEGYYLVLYIPLNRYAVWMIWLYWKVAHRLYACKDRRRRPQSISGGRSTLIHFPDGCRIERQISCNALNKTWSQTLTDDTLTLYNLIYEIP